MSPKAISLDHLPRQFRFSAKLGDDEEPTSFTIDTYNYILKPPKGVRRGWYATVREQAQVKLTATRQGTILYGPYPSEEAAISAVQGLLQKTVDAAQETAVGDMVVDYDAVVDRSDEESAA